MNIQSKIKIILSWSKKAWSSCWSKVLDFVRRRQHYLKYRLFATPPPFDYIDISFAMQIMPHIVSTLLQIISFLMYQFSLIRSSGPYLLANGPLIYMSVKYGLLILFFLLHPVYIFILCIDNQFQQLLIFEDYNNHFYSHFYLPNRLLFLP